MVELQMNRAETQMNRAETQMNRMEDESCAPNRPPLPAVTVVAMAYIPFQQFNTVYAPEKGYEMGTIFPELDKPFLGGGRR
ncbi:MAG TPA: spore coat associated protein CotJA [Ruminiclostridium sp.]|nr:spore coat associated protein CotJA [Ruminiclostridium sp.]